MSNKAKLELDTQMLNRYLAVSDELSVNNQEELYRWYLLFESIYFSYMGLNNHTFKDLNSFKEYYSKAKKNNITIFIKSNLSRIVSLLFYLEQEIISMREKIMLPLYKKIAIRKSILLKTENEISRNIDNIVLLNLSILVQLPDSSTCSRKVDIKDIKYNIAKENIFNIDYTFKGMRRCSSVTEFERGFGRLGDVLSIHIDSEIYSTNSQNYYENIVNEAIEIIRQVFPIRNIPKISLIDELPINKDLNKVRGVYRNGEIYIKNNLTQLETIEEIIHKIGKFIHDRYFGNRPITFPSENYNIELCRDKPDLFADSFFMLTFRQIPTPNAIRMLSILESLV